jgi:hypothetical protein
MQADGALRGASTIPRRRRLNALMAIVVIPALVALLVWAAPIATSGVGTEDARAGSAAVIHDDAGNVQSNAGAGSATVHDDAGSVHAR